MKAELKKTGATVAPVLPPLPKPVCVLAAVPELAPVAAPVLLVLPPTAPPPSPVFPAPEHAKPARANAQTIVRFTDYLLSSQRQVEEAQACRLHSDAEKVAQIDGGALRIVASPSS